MDYIIATQNTLLKKKPIQSSQLLDSDIKKVSVGEEYKVESYLYSENSHYQIKIPVLGKWYIYDTSGKNSHWDCSWEDSHETENKGDERSPNTGIKTIISTPHLVNWNNPEIYISKYFRTGEVTKQDYRRIPISGSIQEKNILALACDLDKLREYWGSGLVVTSWYRPHAVNAAVGGATRSFHLTGKGVDIYPLNGQLRKFQNLCLRYWRGGVGRGYPRGFVHLDSRVGLPAFKQGTPTAVWNY